MIAWLTPSIKYCRNDTVLRTARRMSAAVIRCSVRGRPASNGCNRRAVGRMETKAAA